MPAILSLNSIVPYKKKLVTDDDFSTLAVVLSCAIPVSFSITMIALLIGHEVNPSAWVPQTLQMLISNVIFDSLTIITTFTILSWAISSSGFLRIPLAIMLDLLAAAILACASLYFGLLFTDKVLSLREVFSVLIAKSTDETRLEFGPYFWVMHTTFIPTLIYLFMIMLAWVGKTMLTPVRWFFGKGQEHKNPLTLTAALCGIFIAIFSLLAFVAGEAQKYAEQREAIKKTSVSQLFIHKERRL
jgi:hypothetical protein